MKDQSYIPLQKSGRLVWSEAHRKMAKVDKVEYSGPYPHDPDQVFYTLWMDGVRHGHYGEQGLRKPTFGEFLWYKDPETRGLKIGANRAWPLLFANAIGVAGIIANGIPTDFWTALVTAVCFGITVGTILGTLSNYRTQWR